MPGRIPDSLIHQILDRVNLAELIGQQVKLRRVGRNFVGLCPFHADGSPSFSVSAEKGVYKCFGCGEAGNAITYLTKGRGMSFMEAAEQLASLAGVELEFEQGDRASYFRSREKRKALLDLNREAHQFFRSTLSGPAGEPGRSYLEQRGVGKRMGSVFQIGFCPAGSELYKQLVKRGAPLNLAEEVGLIVKSERTGQYRDRLSGRVVFPILTVGGEVAGFSGRTLPGGPEPKYLNSPESEVFKKGELLFALVAAREAIKKSDFSVLVEGQLDALALHEAGIENAVAPLGTALTEHQCAVLRRFSPNVVIMFDGDDAGRKATWRAMTLLMNQGLYGKVACLPNGEDPDSLLRKSGVEAVRKVVEAAMPFLEFAVETLTASAAGSLHGRTLAAKAGVDFAGNIANAIDRQLFIEQLSMRLGVSATSLRVEAVQARPQETAKAPQVEEAELTRKERRLVELLAVRPELARLAAETEEFDCLVSPRVKAFAWKLLDTLEELGRCDSFQVAEQIGDKAISSICVGAVMDLSTQPDGVLEQSAAGLMLSLREDRLRGKLDGIAASIRTAESAGKIDELVALTGQQDTVLRDLAALITARKGV